MSTPCDVEPTRQDPSAATMTGPSPTRRHRGRRRRSAARAACWPGPASVWLCHCDDHPEPPGVLSGWPLAAITTIVTVYSRRGDHVLLLASPDDHPASGSLVDPVATRHGRRGLAGLADAARSVAGLGRTVHTEPTESARPSGADPGDEPESGSESASGPSPGEPDPGESGLGPGRSGRVAQRTGPAPRHHLIITVVDPDAVHAFQPGDWADRLYPSGTLAVLTHSDTERGRLLDPTGPIVRAVDRAGLRFRDHIVVLERPLREVCPRSGIPPARTDTAEAVPVGHGHTDLLVFDLAPAASTPTTELETSDD
jgi:hypothetical protein